MQVQRNKSKFDLEVHRRDNITGQIVHVDPYRMVCRGEQKFFERPKGSGIFYYENGSRVSDADVKNHNLEAFKMPFTAQQTEAERLRSENAALRARIDAMKADVLNAENSAPVVNGPAQKPAPTPEAHAQTTVFSKKVEPNELKFDDEDQAALNKFLGKKT